MSVSWTLLSVIACLVVKDNFKLIPDYRTSIQLNFDFLSVWFDH